MKKTLFLLLLGTVLLIPILASAAVIPWTTVETAVSQSPYTYTIAAGDVVEVPQGTFNYPNGIIYVEGALVFPSASTSLTLQYIVLRRGYMVGTDGNTNNAHGEGPLYGPLDATTLGLGWRLFYVDFNGGTHPYITNSRVWFNYNDGCLIGSLQVPTRAGYTFGGWEDDSGNLCDNTDYAAVGKTYKARWIQNSGGSSTNYNRPPSSLPKTGDGFPLWEMLGAVALLACASVFLLMRVRKLPHN